MIYNPALRWDSLFGPFPYRQLPEQVNEDATLRYRERVRAKDAELVKKWTSQDQSEWLVRHYLASKLMMAGGLMLASAEYSEQRRLHVPIPYLIYYGLFHACRAFMLTVPFIKWRDAALLKFSHDKTRNVAVNELVTIDAILAKSLATMMMAARTRRELFSYSFPANGPESIGKVQKVSLSDATSMAQLLCEVAQLNSEALEAALDELQPSLPYDSDCVEKYGVYKTHDGIEIIDREDLYRLDQLFRREPHPRNIWSQTREGFVDDFAGAWGAGEGNDNDFDSDRGVTFIFPFQ